MPEEATLARDPLELAEFTWLLVPFFRCTFFRQFYQRFNVCCFHACPGQTLSPLSPSSILTWAAHHSALTRVPSCPRQHILSTYSYSCLYHSHQQPPISECFNPVITILSLHMAKPYQSVSPLYIRYTIYPKPLIQLHAILPVLQCVYSTHDSPSSSLPFLVACLRLSSAKFHFHISVNS